MCNSKKSYDGIIHQRYLCAGVPEGGKDGCTYDSGGPLMCARSDDDPWYLVGMMVWGDGCARKDKYGVYTNVTQVMTMIRNTVKGNSFIPLFEISVLYMNWNDRTDKSNKKRLVLVLNSALNWFHRNTGHNYYVYHFRGVLPKF